MDRSGFKGFIGTYTDGKSDGIYTFELDREKGRIENIRIAAKLNNPTYLALSSDNRYLYSVMEKEGTGGVAAFSVTASTRELKTLNHQAPVNSAPCHVSVDHNNHYLVTANYHNGSVESYPINQMDGTVNPVTSIVKHQGEGPNKERQEQPHVHFAAFSPDENFVIIVDFGMDQVMTYKLINGELNRVTSLAVEPGSGPRHLIFHPNGRYAYVLTELSSEVITTAYNRPTGSFTEVQYVSALPEDFNGESYGSAIRISSDGRFVYAANRGHDSIAMFGVDQDTCKLTLMEHTSTEGEWPRDFVLDPSENFLIASNQYSSNLTLFSRDKETGKLTLLQANIEVPHPVCVKFLNV